MSAIDYRLYLVTDDPSRYRGPWLENVDAAIAGGVTCVQYRDTESDDAALLTRALALKDLLNARHIPLIINNNAALAATVGATGVHVGQSDMPPKAVREIVGPKVEIGLSITCIDQIAAFRVMPKGLVSCLGIGPVFDATKTKADAAGAIGLTGLAEIAAATADMANVAIGGLTRENAGQVRAAGVKGLALVSAFSRADDPCAAAQQLRAMFK